jgi:diguanylate cyclase (GGDEF)-like protein
VLCVGLDDFKGINEQFSYQTGDQLLLALADRLRAHSGRLGALARLGGDQFALVQADIEQPYEAAELAQSILDDLEAPFDLDHQQIRLRATIGITLFPEDGDSTEKLLQKAEQTMTLAKTRSRNRYQFYIASVDSEMRRRRELEKDLRDALIRNQFYLVYQPQISYRDHRVVGVEALIAGSTRSMVWYRRTCSSRWPNRTAPSSPSANGCWIRPANNCANGTTRASRPAHGGQPVHRASCTTPSCRGWSTTCCRSTACHRAAWSWKSPKPA